MVKAVMATERLPAGSGLDLLVSGPVPDDNALYGFLADHVLRGVLGVRCPRPRFRLERLGGSSVLRCDEEQTSVSLALKSYDLKWIDGTQATPDQHEERAWLMRREFDNIRRVRDLGLDRPPLRAVRPLATHPDLGCLLVEEFVSGPDLHFAIREAAMRAEHALLSTRLAQVAAFLAWLHNASAAERACDDREGLAYLEKMIGQLINCDVISMATAERLHRIRQRWQAAGELNGAGEVLIHGDATPTQFLFPDDGELVAIDFERLHYADRAADIGRIAGELKHLFASYALDPWASEPFIRGFYDDYYRAAPQAGDFGWLIERARFHMGCSELRIARNSWEDFGHRRWLAEEAVACLDH
jgi:aminoglycoside phosphotransferase (APT) family kinase protein